MPADPRYPDTVPIDPGAARGHIEDCTDHGALDDSQTRMPAPSAGWVVLVALACFAAIAACALIANHLPPMAWPLG